MKNITNVSAFIWQYGFCLVLFFSGILQAQTQEKTVTGIVTTDSIPLMGVSVTIKDTNKGVITDIDGEYQIQVQPGDILIYSHLGYEERAIQFLNQKEIDIELQLDATALGTVEITGGYYSLDERTRTGNVTKVDRTQLDQQVIQSPIEALQGRVAGLEVQTRSGLSGQAPKVLLRGQSSLDYDNTPLYIIDGIQISNQGLGSLNLLYDSSTSIDPLSTLDPSLIESIEVLKDADATAIYGSQGANGVIIINTKRGQAGKTKLDFQAETGISWVGHFMDLMNTEQYLEMRREAFENDGVEATPANAPDLLLWDQNRYTDWQKELIGGHAQFQKYQATMSGGNEQTNFLLSGGTQKETTVFPGNFSFLNNNILANINHKSLDNNFHLNTSINYGYKKSNLFRVGAFVNNALQLPPNAPELFDNGAINWAIDEHGNPSLDSPLKGLLEPNTMRIKSLQWNGTLAYNLLNNLGIKLNIGFNDLNTDDKQLLYKRNINPLRAATAKSTTNRTLISKQNIMVEPQVEYAINWNEHRVSSLIGGTFRKNVEKSLALRAQDYFSESQVGNIALAREQNVLLDETIKYRYAATFGRIGYSYSDKYYLNLTGRRDGSSRFGKNNRFGNFGAIGGAWEFSKEGFIKKIIPQLSSGKLRGSYGITGSDNIGDYQYRNTYSNINIVPNSLSKGGLIPDKLNNPYYQWEKNKKLEVAIEFGLWDSRLEVFANWYQERSGNQLVGITLPSITGFNLVQGNLNAIVQNTGWEFLVVAKPLKTKEILWESSINLTIPRNKLVAFPNLKNSNYAFQYEIGKPLGIRKLYNFTGIDTNTGKYTFEDINEDEILNNNDQIKTVNLSRKAYGGWSNTFRYKNWSLFFLIEFVHQKGMDIVTGFGTPGGQANKPVKVLDRWTKEDPSGIYQGYTQNYDAGFYNYTSSTANITDASFLRMKSISLAYRLPNKWMGTFPIQNGEIYINGQNLFTLSPYQGLDPQINSGINLPALNSVHLGLKLTI